MKTLLVRARPGATVPREGRSLVSPGGAITDAEAVPVVDSAYYRRRLRDGDLVLDVPPAAPRRAPSPTPTES